LSIDIIDASPSDLMTNIPPRPSNAYRFVGAGFSLAISILFCMWLGYLADKRWGSQPWGLLIGAFLGIGAGLYNFIKDFADVDTNSKSNSGD
jgi:F0F1-type ATP synthase assembly protein I